MNSNRENGNGQGSRTGIIIAVMCGVGFLGCLAWLVIYMKNISGTEGEIDALRQEYVVDIPNEGNEPNPSASAEPKFEPEASPAPTEEPSPLIGYDIPNKVVDIKALQENENEDIYAWLIVPGTVIDYPVLQHPEELDYYLHHNVDHSSGYPGCIYSQNINSKEWDDPNTVLYGHNMRNGSMFAELHHYEDSEFLEENQYIYIFTQNHVRVYHIFGAYEYDNRHLLLAMDTTDPATFAKYLVEIQNLKGMRDNFLEDVPVSIENNILTLETCVTNKPDKRYIVQAILEAEGAWPIAGAEGTEE